ncbi:MAG: hypothetical protein M3N13_02075 [Candidatus Eremiobacteraeota bacterium]|nr:hypothetical protein [Candidatus Eremiobacteraeota bacterium]
MATIVSVSTDPEALAEDLREYGEFELAARIATLVPEQLEAIWTQGGAIASQGTSVYGQLPLRKALVVAAVEVLEGHARPLKDEVAVLLKVFRTPDTT